MTSVPDANGPNEDEFRASLKSWDSDNLVNNKQRIRKVNNYLKKASSVLLNGLSRMKNSTARLNQELMEVDSGKTQSERDKGW